MANIGWIDFSSEHREKVRTVLDLLKKRGVLDELGIGFVRDGFADRMFPGLTTIQTRAKYFTLTAYLIQEFIDQRRGRGSLEDYLRKRELDCRIQLVERDGEELGIIGGSFGTDRRKDVIRKPSSIYWNGLRTFGFVSPALSLSEFSARLTSGKASLGRILKGAPDDDGETAGGLAPQQARVTIQAPPSEYWEHLEVDLTPAEAQTLRQQITVNQPDSLIGQILLYDGALEQVLQLHSGADFAAFSELPFIRELKAPGLAACISHARDFWRIMEGAHIRYNCLLQDGADDPSLGDQFQEEWETWRDALNPFPASWDSSFMWDIVSAGGARNLPSRHFIKAWIGECRKGCADLARCDELVRLQELRNKGSRARLASGNRGGHPPQRIGFDDLNYRLPVALQLLRDIHNAESGGGSDA